MRFHKVRIPSELNPKETLATYFASESGNYRVQPSLRGKQWLAFFRTSEDPDSFALVGPPTQTKKAAIDQCCEHSLALPW
jgi:hypothetical protein